MQGPLSSIQTQNFSFHPICFGLWRAAQQHSASSQHQSQSGGAESYPGTRSAAPMGWRSGCGLCLYLKSSRGSEWLAQSQDVRELSSWATACHPTHILLRQSLGTQWTQLLRVQMNRTSCNWHSGTWELVRVSRTTGGADVS